MTDSHAHLPPWTCLLTDNLWRLTDVLLLIRPPHLQIQLNILLEAANLKKDQKYKKCT